ncbi:MAG: hypothetical protein WC547_02365 [Candidatus Omnitrophota bacterium]
MKSCVLVYYMFVVCVFLCGCETAGAFGTGRITSSDVAYIAHAGALGKTTTPVNVDSLEDDKEYVPPPDSGVRRTRPRPKISKADSWLEDNLW